MNHPRIIKNGLIGAHIGRSRFSKAMDLLCREHDMDLDFTSIDSAEIDGFDFENTVQNLIKSGWTGVTVTHPHKIEARDFAGNGMIAGLEHLPASNLLTFKPPLRAFNTDYSGFIGAWKSIMGEANPGAVAVAGAGGVAGAIVPALEALGADDIAVWDLQPGKASILADQCGERVRAIDPADAPDAISRATGLVNATALGMGDNKESAFPDKIIDAQNWAFDAVYTPVATPFLSLSASRGLTTISGFDLFRFMILDSFEAYSGIKPDANRMLPLIDALKPK